MGFSGVKPTIRRTERLREWLRLVVLMPPQSAIKVDCRDTRDKDGLNKPLDKKR